jgi:hypothetical protein
MFNRIILSILLVIAFTSSRAQTPGYPKVTGFAAVLQPLTTWTKAGFASNFGNVYVIGFPFGVNILKSDNFGVSFEIVPAIRTEKNISRMSTVLFHPGAMFRFKHGFTFIGRMAFETSGRYGVTPVFNQVIKKGKDASMYVSVPLPVRFGMDLPMSIGAGLQVGVSF